MDRADAPAAPLTARTDRGEALRGHGAMVIFACLISVSFVLGKRAAPTIDPAALTAARFLLAASVMAAVAAPLMRRAHFAAFWRYALMGGLLASYFILMFEALRLTDSVSTAAVFTLTPIMTAGFGWLLMRQRTGLRMALALALGGLGALWVIFRADVAALIALDFGHGERLFLIGCALHALYTPLFRKLNRGEPGLVFAAGTLAGGLVPTLAWGWRDVAATDWAALPPVAWAAVLYLALGATAATIPLMRFAALRLPSAKVMAYGYLVPSLVVLWEGLLTGGWVAAPVWLGVAATAGALALLLKGEET